VERIGALEESVAAIGATEQTIIEAARRMGGTAAAHAPAPTRVGNPYGRPSVRARRESPALA
jgi:hypothetical protein